MQSKSNATRLYPCSLINIRVVIYRSVGDGRYAGFDQRGQTDQSTLSVTADGTTTTQTVNMTYNDAGQQTSLVYPDSEVLSTSYNNNDYLRSAFFGGADSTVPVTYRVGQVSYTNNGQMSGMAFGGSARINHGRKSI